MRPYALLLLTVLMATLAPIAAADEDFSVVINGRTGAALLRNDSTSTIQLDGYLLRSPGADVFNTASWSRLANNLATPGWTASPGGPDRLSEANLFGSTPVAPGASLSIGTPYVPFAPSSFGEPEPGVESLEFSYSTLAGAFNGDVEFISRNTIVLVVDPNSGAAKLQNQSSFPVSIDSYLVKSVPAVLDAAGWTPLAESLGGAGGWTAAAGQATRIAEGNLFGATPLAPNGGSLSLGEPIDPAMLEDETDLVLEFTVTGLGSIEGGVLFQSTSSPIVGDFDGNGSVGNSDLTLLLDNWGETVPPMPVGWTGYQPTPAGIGNDELTALLDGWGDVAGAGSVVATVVPEPAAWSLLALAGVLVKLTRRSRAA